MNILSLVTFATLLFFGGISHAQFKITFNESLPPEVLHSAGVSDFIKRTTDRLPQLVKQEIGSEVVFSFKRLRGKDDIPLECKKTLSGGPNIKAEAAYESLGVLGNTTKRKSSGKYHVTLHEPLLREILLGMDKSGDIPCLIYQNYFEVAVGAAIHEIIHIYDSVDRSTFKNIPSKISDRSQFQNLVGCYMGISELNNKNKLYSQSPNMYEFRNCEEAFAVNAEHFLIDSMFKCRRPAVYNFYRTTFWFEGPSSNCSPDTRVLVGKNYYPTLLDPNRVYEIHYFFAGKGEALMSRWGHAMYRIIMCAPKRKEVGPVCLEDLAYHVIVSFRADVTNFAINPFDAFFGGYPSQLFLLTLPEVLHEYTRRELREVFSLPIKLASYQREQFIYRTLQQYWDYQGSYAFLTNNCATEAQRLLKSALPEGHPFQMKSAISPLGMQELLEDLGMIDTKLAKLDDDKTNPEGIKLGYYFRSLREEYNRIFGMLRGLGAFQEFGDLEHLFSESKQHHRLRDFNILISRGDKSFRLKISSAFILLENYFEDLLVSDVEKEVMKMLAQHEKNHGKDSQDPLSVQLRKLADQRQLLLPWKTLKYSNLYGIPQLTEWKKDIEILEDANRLNNTLHESLDLLTELGVINYQEVFASKALKDIFRNSVAR